LVAAIAYAWGLGLFRTNAVLWALFVAAPMVAVWDTLWPASELDWKSLQEGLKRQGGIDVIDDIRKPGAASDAAETSFKPATGRGDVFRADAGARRADGRIDGVVAAG
jgi:hypothetical protein